MKFSAELREPCAPLPKLVVGADDADVRPEILENRVMSEKVHSECASRHDRTLRAAGSTPQERRELRRARVARDRAQATPTE